MPCSRQKRTLSRTVSARADSQQNGAGNASFARVADKGGIEVHSGYLLRYAVVAHETSYLAKCCRTGPRKGLARIEEQRDTDADHGHRIEQAGNNEHLNLQGRNHFRLAGSSLEKLAAQQGKADGGAQRTQAQESRPRR